jgi:hypothetical protein
MDAKTELSIKIEARRVYLWLLLSPIVTMPYLLWQGFNISYQAGFGERLQAVATPLVLHFPLIAWLLSSQLFVKRHAQQGLILVLARFISAVLILGSGRYIYRACSLMTWRGEDIYLPSSRDIKTLKKELKIIEQAARAKAKRPKEKSPVERASAEGKLMTAQNYLLNGAADQAVGYFVEAFHQGDRATRREALQALEELGEVEVF